MTLKYIKSENRKHKDQAARKLILASKEYEETTEMVMSANTFYIKIVGIMEEYKDVFSETERYEVEEYTESNLINHI